MTNPGTWLRGTLWIGLVAGLVTVYLTAIGIVLAFAERNVLTGVFTLGQVMLALPPLGAGYVAARRMGGGSVARVLVALVAGATAGAVLGLALFFASGIEDLRDILVRISKQLIAYVSFDQPPSTGALLHLALGAVLGAAAGVLQVLPPQWRRMLLAGAVSIVVLPMLEPFLRPRLTEFGLIEVSRLIFDSKGLTIPAAIITFVLVSAVSVAWRPARSAVQSRVARSSPEVQRMLRWTLGLIGIALLLYVPNLAGPLLTQVLVIVGLYVLLALGLNIVVGYAGLLDLGYVAFYAVGSYFTALLTSPTSSLGLGLPFLVALPIVVIASATVGLLIGAPVLRLRGDYLAIVTLGFGEIARLLFLSDALEPWLGGTQGILGIPDIFGVSEIELPILGVIKGPSMTYYPLVLLSLLAAFVATRLKYSRVGRAWNAMREDEDVAQATGINITNYKLMAFAMGASVGCLGGAVFATHLESVFPGSFGILVSITVLAVVILGGMGSISGVILGAFLLIGLPELLREFAEFKLLVYGGVLVLMMLLRPEGLVPDVARKRELHEGSAEPEAEAAPA